MSAIQNINGNLILDSINIVDETGFGIDIKKSLKEFQYFSEIGKFDTARLTISTQYPLRSKFPLKGTEKIIVSWSSSYDSQLLTKTFMIYQLNDILYQEQISSDTYTFTLVDEKFKTFLQKYAYQQHFFNMTISAIMSEIFAYYEVPLQIETDDMSVASYNTYSDDILKSIDDILMLFSKAHCLIPADLGMKLTNYDMIFKQPLGYKYVTKTIQQGQFKQDVNTLKILRKFDVINNKEIYEKGYNGYKYFNIDAYNKIFLLTDVFAIPSNKFLFGPDKRNIRTMPTRRFEENQLYSEGLECSLILPTTKIVVGDLISLEVDEPINPDKESYYNGIWAIHSIIDIIDANFVFNRMIRLIRK